MARRGLGYVLHPDPGTTGDQEVSPYRKGASTAWPTRSSALGLGPASARDRVKMLLDAGPAVPARAYRSHAGCTLGPGSAPKVEFKLNLVAFLFVDSGSASSKEKE